MTFFFFLAFLSHLKRTPCTLPDNHIYKQKLLQKKGYTKHFYFLELWNRWHSLNIVTSKCYKVIYMHTHTGYCWVSRTCLCLKPEHILSVFCLINSNLDSYWHVMPIWHFAVVCVKTLASPEKSVRRTQATWMGVVVWGKMTPIGS